VLTAVSAAVVFFVVSVCLIAGVAFASVSSVAGVYYRTVNT